MSFTVINEEFICNFCGEENSPAFRTCRNHCKNCLSALHVDKNSPGDRKSDCLGEMKIFAIDSHPKHTFMITHKCIKCGKKIKNRAADDDNREKIFDWMKKKSSQKFRSKN